MRYPLSASLFTSLCLLLIGLVSAGLPTDPKNSGRIPVGEAVKKGLQVSLHKASGKELFSGHYGPCIQLTVENTSRRGIRTILPAGTWLHPSDSSEQNMLVTQERLLVVLQSSRVTVGIYNSEGLFVSAFIENKEQRPGRHGFEFELDIYDTQAAPYWARVIVNGEEKVKQLIPIRDIVQ